MPDRFVALLDLISSAHTLSGIEQALQNIREVYGLANVIYHAIRIPGVESESPIMLLTCDPQWTSLYMQRDYLRIDPIIKAGRRSFLPIDWREVDHSSVDARHFFAEATRYGVGRRGMSWPIRGANGERAIFSVTSDVTEQDWTTQRVVCLRDLQMIGQLIHDRAIRLAGFSLTLPKAPLSTREVQCLEAISNGRTPKQIAVDLGISPSAVRIYLHSILGKLDCTTLPQAVGVAFHCNIIGA
ncbi:LuxR family transcriptional regulator [Bradyrhizobium sp. 2TAF24]|uniref:LuxR family transcriptional regulator n=1 Tax=Bradyrhizobium sp. 2TAF24 TaxID=3233011 RepID=UPI003F8DC6A4